MHLENAECLLNLTDSSPKKSICELGTLQIFLNATFSDLKKIASVKIYLTFERNLLNKRCEQNALCFSDILEVDYFTQR